MGAIECLGLGGSRGGRDGSGGPAHPPATVTAAREHRSAATERYDFTASQDRM